MKKAKQASIKILADECVGKKTIEQLRRAGYDVESIRELGLRGLPNGNLISRAIKEREVFLTEDLDFSNILMYPLSSHHGIILLRSARENESDVHKNLLKLLEEIEPRQFDKTLFIVDENKYRLRR